MTIQWLIRPVYVALSFLGVLGRVGLCDLLLIHSWGCKIHLRWVLLHSVFSTSVLCGFSPHTAYCPTVALHVAHNSHSLYQDSHSSSVAGDFQEHVFQDKKGELPISVGLDLETGPLVSAVEV